MLSSSPRILVLLSAVVVAACSSSSSDTSNDVDADHADGAPQDTGANDSSSSDSSPTDSSPADSAASDTASSDGDATDPCSASGGTVGTALCCTSASDFPNNCATGACGCAPSASHEVKVCNCPAPDCWNGTACVTPPG